MTFRFYYRELFERDVVADSYSEALRILTNSTKTVFGIHPLDFDDYDIL